MLRFHLDENVDHAVAVGLRGRGIEASTTEDAKLNGASDEEQMAFALQKSRVIVTHDPDLLTLHSDGVPHAGIAFCALRTKTIGQIVLKLSALSRHFDPQDMAGRIEFL
jgi:predicted nuclease of predicted toxin-antitoxin system